jgi:DNA-binding GntR family transcriptional regulator
LIQYGPRLVHMFVARSNEPETYHARQASGPVRAAERAYSTIKQRIAAGTYKAGERISIDDLRAELEVSKQPIMESLRRLSVEGLVTIVPQVGCRVRSYGHGEIADFFRLMAAVEGEAASLAAKRWTGDELARLASVSQQIAGIVDEPSEQVRADAYHFHNRVFHSTLHKMTGAQIVEEVGSSLYDRADLLINGASTHAPLAAAVRERYEDHEEIVDALRRRDAVAARATAAAHILGTVELIERAVARDRSQPAE